MESASHHRKRELSDRYRFAVDRVSAILFAADPIGIAEGNPHLDEYGAEARKILARLDEAGDRADLGRITYEVFVDMFSEADAGPASKYVEIANDLWLVVQELRRV